MKKLVYLLLLALVPVLGGCNDEPKESNPLIGTKWSYSLSPALANVEFVDNQYIVAYYSDGDVPTGDSYSAKYTFKDNKLTFIGWEMPMSREFKDGYLLNGRLHINVTTKPSGRVDQWIFIKR